MEQLARALSAWWGLTTAAERHRLEAVRHSFKLLIPDQLSLAELVATADDDLFFRVKLSLVSCLLRRKEHTV